MPFIPHTQDDIETMLATIGAATIDELFDEIPPELRIDQLTDVPAGLSEAQVSQLMESRAAQDAGIVSFIGGGAYEHYIPAAVWDIATRGEFYSAYTPYQAEASQGTLQVIYEYQSMMTALTGLEVSNASLYDGATAFAEACLMAIRANRKSRSRRILTTGALHPEYRAVARTMLHGQGIELVELPVQDGRTASDALASVATEDFAAVAVQQPTFLGTLEPVAEITDWAHERGALVVAVCNPLSLAVLVPPGCWGATGADIACGEGQPLGIPVASGGPYFGYLVCRQSLVRQMPGRLVGRTLTVDGKPGFTLTLQAREQHIRRSKATSNICTNQGLMVTAATIYMSLLGAEGLRRTATQCHDNTRRLAEKLAALDGIELVFDQFFHEAVLRLDRPVQPVLDALAMDGIAGGLALATHYPDLGHALLVCATEQRTADDIDRYVDVMRAVLERDRAA